MGADDLDQATLVPLPVSARFIFPHYLSRSTPFAMSLGASLLRAFSVLLHLSNAKPVALGRFDPTEPVACDPISKYNTKVDTRID